MIREKLAARRSVEATGFRWRAGDVTRLEQFSDAVFGFALALLVVSGDVPRTADELFTALRGFPAFGATFATLIWIWYYHYLYFRRFGFVDAATVTLNAVLLFLILFFVYPLKFMFNAIFTGMLTGVWGFRVDQGHELMVIYSLGFAAIFSMFALLYRHALRLHHDLELTDIEIFVTRGSMFANLILVGVGLTAAAANWLGPAWIAPFTGMFYGVTGPLMWWHWSRFGRALKQLGPVDGERLT